MACYPPDIGVNGKLYSVVEHPFYHEGFTGPRVGLSLLRTHLLC